MMKNNLIICFAIIFLGCINCTNIYVDTIGDNPLYSKEVHFFFDSGFKDDEVLLIINNQKVYKNIISSDLATDIAGTYIIKKYSSKFFNISLQLSGFERSFDFKADIDDGYYFYINKTINGISFKQSNESKVYD